MTQRDLIAIALKLLGIVCLVFAIDDLPQAVSFLAVPQLEGWRGHPSPINFRAAGWGSVIHAAALAAMASVLLHFTGSLARRLAPVDAALPPAGGGLAPLFELAVRFLG